MWWAKSEPLVEIGLPDLPINGGGASTPPTPQVPTALRRTMLSGNLILTSSAGRGALFLPYMGTSGPAELMGTVGFTFFVEGVS